MPTTRKGELSVITKAKELSSYIMTVTEKSSKRFRFTLVSRMRNYALDVIENLYIANEVFVQPGRMAHAERRQTYQQTAPDQTAAPGLHRPACYGAAVYPAEIVYYDGSVSDTGAV